jgi:transcriptional regulator of acetoin/glycerol metabolism
MPSATQGPHADHRPRGMSVRTDAAMRIQIDHRKTAKDREYFLSGLPPAAGGVDEVVLDSWRRSRALGIDPSGRTAPLTTHGDAFEMLRRRHSDLIAAAAPIFARTAALIEGSGSILLLTSPDGIVLEAAGDAATLDYAQAIHLVKGGDWRENVVGTNGIGTAIASCAPAQVHGHEHYCEGILSWTCAAAPVMDRSTGRIMGVVDLSGPPTTYQRSSLALVLALAGQLESTLADRRAQQESRLLTAALERLSASDIKQGVIVLDRAGRLAHASHGLSLPLAIGQGLPGIDAAQPVESWSRNLPHWVDATRFHPVCAGTETLGALAFIGARRRVHQSTLPAPAAHDTSPTGFAAILGHAPALQAAIERARLLAPRNVPVLIQGETGVGKELFARAIHAASTPHAPFVVMNCGAVARDLLASELFGHARGAFTGAQEARTGCFELADGGILCLDEIGELPLDLQPHLLRILEGGILYRVGDSRPRQVHVRLLAVTNRDLAQEVEAGRFRRDLYHRISVTQLTVPPLRDRPGDIPLLVDHFAHELASRHGLPMPVFHAEAMARLNACTWPGNIRELRNVVESLLLTTGDTPILAGALDGLIGSNSASSPGTLGETERQAISRTIEACAGNLTQAARQLGISRSTLYRKMGHVRSGMRIDD